MRFRVEVREKLREIKDFMTTLHEQKLFYEKEIERLVAQNKGLMDRLMSRNFETLMTYQPPEVATSAVGSSLPADEDEQNAGEILDIEA